jgi:hypothetical protein
MPRTLFPAQTLIRCRPPPPWRLPQFSPWGSHMGPSIGKWERMNRADQPNPYRIFPLILAASSSSPRVQSFSEEMTRREPALVCDWRRMVLYR